MDRGATNIVTLQLAISRACQLRKHAGTHDIERTKVPRYAKAHQGTLVLEDWNPVAMTSVVPGSAALMILRSFSSASRTSSGAILRVVLTLVAGAFFIAGMAFRTGFSGRLK